MPIRNDIQPLTVPKSLSGTGSWASRSITIGPPDSDSRCEYAATGKTSGGKEPLPCTPEPPLKQRWLLVQCKKMASLHSAQRVAPC